MQNSLHLKLDDKDKMKFANEIDIYRKEISQLQECLQNSYLRINKLNEEINKQRNKIFRLEANRLQLEFDF